MSRYVIITPAYNEAAYLAATVESVVQQTALPERWVIVDDGSQDETPRIAQEACSQYPWIQYSRRERSTDHTYYASNVYAIRQGVRCLDAVEYEYLAILDADISLPPDYYVEILRRFEKYARLGIASGVYVERTKNGFRKVLNDRRSTPKALMVFRKACYEEVSGFLPMKYGGEDTCACFAARMAGWKTWSFPEMVAIHNKPLGTGHAKGRIRICFRLGIGEHYLGSHPLFVLAKSIRRCFGESPFLAAGLSRLAGYLTGFFMHESREVPADLLRFIRKEQWQRLVGFNRVPTDIRIE
jgi:poly-beta-1,6-N-acetyl-D-glucosamine synthase